MVWDRLDLVRVYTKPKGANPDYNDPVCLKRKDVTGATVEDFCNHIHKTMAKAMRHALVWGTSVKHRPQKVGKEHLLQVSSRVFSDLVYEKGGGRIDRYESVAEECVCLRGVENPSAAGRGRGADRQEGVEKVCRERID